KRVTFWPKRVIRPSVGRASPLIRLNKVVFPAPFGPIRARRSPVATARLTSSTARRPSNAFETFERLRARSGDSVIVFCAYPCSLRWGIDLYPSFLQLHGGSLKFFSL